MKLAKDKEAEIVVARVQGNHTLSPIYMHQRRGLLA